MTLKGWLETLPAFPDHPDPAKPRLLVVKGMLNSDTERYVRSDEYGGVYAYLLFPADAPVQRYDNGTARWLGPFDVVLEAPNTPENLESMTKLWTFVHDEAPFEVDELEDGLRLAGQLAWTSALKPEVREKGLLSASLRGETNWT